MSFKNRDKKNPEVHLMVKYFAHIDPMMRNSQEGRGKSLDAAIEDLERRLLDNTVEWAYLQCNHTGEKLHYYHHRHPGGIKQRIYDKEKYKLIAFDRWFNLWVVPTAAARRAGRNAYTVKEVPTESLRKDILKHYNKHVDRIDIYFKNKVVDTYKKGQFTA